MRSLQYFPCVCLYLCPCVSAHVLLLECVCVYLRLRVDVLSWTDLPSFSEQYKGKQRQLVPCQGCDKDLGPVLLLLFFVLCCCLQLPTAAFTQPMNTHVQSCSRCAVLHCACLRDRNAFMQKFFIVFNEIEYKTESDRRRAGREGNITVKPLCMSEI